MGAWGYDALDSDRALDWLGNTMDEVELAINRQVTLAEGLDDLESEGEALRAAAELLIVMNDRLSFTDSKNNNLLERTADQLDRLRDDQEWLDCWDDPEPVRESIRLQAVALRDVLKEYPWMR